MEYLQNLDFLEFWELGRYDEKIRNKRIKGVDGADVSYPGADGGAVARKTGFCDRKEIQRRVPAL